MKALSEFASIEEARSYLAPKLKMMHHDMVISLLTKHQCITSLQNSDDENAKGFYLAIRSGVQEYNLMSGHAVGEAQQALLHYLVSIEAVTEAFANECISYCNREYQPYLNTSLHGFLKAKGECPVKSVDPAGRWLKVETKSDCELHSPAIYGDKLGVRSRISSVSNVAAAGKYLCQIPPGYDAYFIDDAYGVM